MALRKSKQVAARAAALSAMDASDTLPLVFEHTIVAGEFAEGDIVEMGALPAGCVLAGPAVLVAEDCDSGTTPALALDVGIMSGDYLSNDGSRTCGAELFSASDVGQAGGVAVSAVAAGLLLAPSANDRSIGVKVNTAAATLVAGKTIRLLAQAAPAPIGM
jgi:hypothetical protein